MSGDDYSFMRSGFHQETENNALQQDLENIGVLFTVFAEDSMRLAVAYMKHAGRRVTATEDFARAFKVRAYYGNQFWNSPHVQEQMEKIRQYIQEEENNISEDEMEDGSDNHDSDEAKFLGFDVISDDEMEPYTNSTCTCDICKNMNSINQKWPSWQPEGLDIILKQAIDQKF